MEKFNSDLNDSLFVAGEQINVPDARKLSVEKCVWTLVHACHCTDANCKLSKCRRMKRIVRHMKKCKKRTGDNCSICKQLLAVCCHHVKHCQEIECPVPFCANVKWKLEQKRIPRAPSVRRKIGATSIQEHESRQQTHRVSRARETLRQFIETLRNPNTPEKQSQILHMLRTNPSLVTALMKLRQVLARKYSASQQGEYGPTLSVYQHKKRVQRRREWLKQQQQLLLLKRYRQEQLRQNNMDELEAQQSQATDNSKESAIRQLIHACQCCDPDCRLTRCRKMKQVVRHSKSCQRRTSGGCTICKQLVALCCHHVRHCLEADCSVPFCFSIKQKLEARRRDAAVEVTDDIARASSSA